jgi:formate hydrogenlyase subunit 3/multisubunit Na+/H+ antiporter MnhD subunit
VSLLGFALAVWLGGALLAWLLKSRPGAARFAGAGSALAGSALGLAGAAATLLGAGPEIWSHAWAVPFGSLSLRLDPLAAVFILPVCIVGGPCAQYGGAYLLPYAGERPIGAPLASYNLLLASMTLVCLADNLLVFLVAWELMTLSSWALVVQEHERETVRQAGRRYLVAAHLATGALLLLVLLLSAGGGSFELSGLSFNSTGNSTGTGAPAALLFLLALAGFGTKAGIVPCHVWLPDAHPAAPSHVSALMSAVMITMGFYGLARFVPLLGPPPPPLWWGLLLMVLGVAGALGGIAFAMAQRDVKRILAYSTIENAGIIALAFGVGLIGTTLNQPGLAALGWLGGLLHLWNHALFKSLLFLGYGAAAQRVHSRDAEEMGGLLRRWRAVGALMVLGAAAIAALPGLNGFTSEWVILYGLLSGGVQLRGASQVALLAAVPALALTGALAAACFARLTGVTLLGEPRSEGARDAEAPGWEMWLPMALLAALCVVAAWVPDQAIALLAPAVESLTPGAGAAPVALVVTPLGSVAMLVALTLGFGVTLGWLLARRAGIRRAPTWGCGYPHPAPRMQYTASSFAEPITRIFQPLLHSRVERGARLSGPWPEAASWRSVTPDRVLEGLWDPMFKSVERALLRLRGLQRGLLSTYLLYIVLTVLALVASMILPLGAGAGAHR